MNKKLDWEPKVFLFDFEGTLVTFEWNLKEGIKASLKEIASNLGINILDLESIKAMFIKDTDNAYKILEIDPSCNDDEVKKGYRKMANKYHPDKVSHLGIDLQHIAEEKFKAVNNAYQTIKKERKI